MKSRGVDNQESTEALKMKILKNKKRNFCENNSKKVMAPMDPKLDSASEKIIKIKNQSHKK